MDTMPSFWSRKKQKKETPMVKELLDFSETAGKNRVEEMMDLIVEEKTPISEIPSTIQFGTSATMTFVNTMSSWGISRDEMR